MNFNENLFKRFFFSFNEHNYSKFINVVKVAVKEQRKCILHAHKINVTKFFLKDFLLLHQTEMYDTTRTQKKKVVFFIFFSLIKEMILLAVKKFR